MNPMMGGGGFASGGRGGTRGGFSSPRGGRGGRGGFRGRSFNRDRDSPRHRFDGTEGAPTKVIILILVECRKARRVFIYRCNFLRDSCEEELFDGSLN